MYYYDENGNIPYQMYYPGVDGVWPLHRWRLLWTWWTDRPGKRRPRTQNAGQNAPNISRYQQHFEVPKEWRGTRLPGMSRTAQGVKSISTRWAVPVEEGLTRMVYLNVERYSERPSLFRRFRSGLTWPYRNWAGNFNFRNMDYDAERYTNYDAPEFLSSTDSICVAIRKLVAEHARGIRYNKEDLDENIAEQMVQETEELAVEQAQGTYAKRLRQELLKR
jgi:hypothetical protein